MISERKQKGEKQFLPGAQLRRARAHRLNPRKTGLARWLSIPPGELLANRAFPAPFVRSVGIQTEQAYLDMVEKEESRGFARLYKDAEAA